MNSHNLDGALTNTETRFRDAKLSSAVKEIGIVAHDEIDILICRNFKKAVVSIIAAAHIQAAYWDEFRGLRVELDKGKNEICAQSKLWSRKNITKLVD